MQDALHDALAHAPLLLRVLHALLKGVEGLRLGNQEHAHDGALARLHPFLHLPLHSLVSHRLFFGTLFRELFGQLLSRHFHRLGFQYLQVLEPHVKPHLQARFAPAAYRLLHHRPMCSKLHHRPRKHLERPRQRKVLDPQGHSPARLPFAPCLHHPLAIRVEGTSHLTPLQAMYDALRLLLETLFDFVHCLVRFLLSAGTHARLCCQVPCPQGVAQQVVQVTWQGREGPPHVHVLLGADRPLATQPEAAEGILNLGRDLVGKVLRRWPPCLLRREVLHLRCQARYIAPAHHHLRCSLLVARVHVRNGLDDVV